MKKILFTGARSGIISKVWNNLLDDYYLYITVHAESEESVLKKKYKDYKNVCVFKLDVTNESDRTKLEDLDVDILVSNAATGESGSIADIDMNKVRDNFEVNVFSNFSVVQIILKNMIRKGKGRIIIMASLAGVMPIPFLGSYCATKASIIKFSECLNLELKLLPSDINVCLIEPGLYNTGFNRMMLDKKYDYMDVNSYFENQVSLIRKSENVVLGLFEKRQLNSIVRQILMAITCEKPKRVYSAPLSQKIFAKAFELFY